MNKKQKDNKRIAKNVFFLYFRMIFTLFIGLYTSRIVLKTLGVQDFGIYNVVGGFVSMFSMVSITLSSAISRFITVTIGENDTIRLKKMFSTVLTSLCLFSVVILIVLEIVGIWYLNRKMNIPAERMTSANWVLQCSILTFLINTISIPYNADIIAHEHIKAFAWINIIEVSLKLFVVFSLDYWLYDRLISYSILILFVAIIIRVIYTLYCNRYFEESKFKFIIEKDILMEISRFFGWNILGTSAMVLRDHGLNLVLNIFCGPIVNAARGISLQVSSALTSFSSNFMIALNPQITKSYVSKDYEYMYSLIYKGSKFSYYLMMILSAPIFIYTQDIIRLWLGVIPEYVISFTKIIIIFSMIELLSNPLIVLVLAIGKMKKYQILISTVNLINLPLSYLILKYQGSPECALISTIIISVLCLISRLLFIRSMTLFSFPDYLNNVIKGVIVVSILCYIFIDIISKYFYNGMIQSILGILIIEILLAITIYTIGINKSERDFINKTIKNKFRIL